MKRALFFIIPLFALFIFNMAISERNDISEEVSVRELIEFTPWYTSLTDSSGLSKAALYEAYTRFSSAIETYENVNDSLLTIIDFSKPSTEKRLYLVDIKNQCLLINSLVAHGQNSGSLFAEKFSNRPKSHMSSLGLYLTDKTYDGKHGYSLRLKGMDSGINDKAYERAIVIHGANYVSDKYIAQIGRIGRSFGCPALPQQINNEVIDLIKNRSCLYIYHPAGIK